MTPTNINSEHYATALQHAVMVPRPAVGRIWAEGQHRLDLVHRMSTADLTNIQPGEGRTTVLTNHNARIVDRLLLIHLDDTRALYLTGAGREDLVRGWLQRYIFFNDDLRLTAAGDSLTQVDLYGPAAPLLAGRLLPAAAGLARHHATSDGDLVIVRLEQIAGDAFALIGPPARIEAARLELARAGVPLADAALRDVLRVEAGLPDVAGELTEDYIPLEAGLWGDVSFSKGCYLGQEIIARMESRGRLAKTMIVFSASAVVPPGTPLKGPGGERGTVTSAVVSPVHGPLGVGFIKPDAAEPGTPLTAPDQPDTRITVRRTPLKAGDNA